MIPARENRANVIAFVATTLAPAGMEKANETSSPICLRLFLQLDSRAFSRARFNAGRSNAALGKCFFSKYLS